MTSRLQRTPTPTKTVRTLKPYPADPPGTPPISRECIDERSKTSSRVERPSSSANITPKKVPPAFNRTRPSPVSPRVLFPPPKKDESHRESKNISPPSVRRKGQEKGVCLWELEDDDDIPALSDSSGEYELSLKDASSPLQNKRTSVTDVSSDPGIRYSGRKTATSKSTASSSLNGGRIVSPPKRRNKSMIEPNTSSGKLPTSPDEHAARLRDIMSKRDKKKKRKKMRKRSNTDGSDVSGVRSNAKSAYADDPVNYLNDKLQNSIKSDDEVSDAESRESSRSSISSLGSRGSKNSSRASASKWKHAKIEKEYPKLIDPDKRSDVSSDVSGASNTSSSIFAATRAKLKGYLTTYKKTEKKKVRRKNSNKSATTTISVQSPARASTSGSERVQGTPDTLFSIDESDLDSPPRKIPSKSPPTASSTSRHQKSFEEKVSNLSTSPTSPPPSSVADKHNTATQVIDLPWSYNNKDTVTDDNSVTDLKKGGLYSGPVNELLKPHGNGNLVVKAMNDSLVTLYGTWDDGNLVSPLIDEKEPTTDDENDIDDKPKPCSPRGRLKVKNDIIMANNIKQPTKSIKYTVNSHYKHNRKSRATTRTERVDMNKIRERTNKNRRKPKLIVKYNIGDACRTPQDMMICCSKEESIDSAGHMKKWDGAFIKRTSGVWTYAVLVERSMQPIDVTKKRLEYMYWASVWEVDPLCEMEDSMLFAIDDDGGTKIIPKRCWAKYVRRVRHNPKPHFSSGASNPLPMEVTVEPTNENDDDATQNSESSEYFKIITQNDSSATGNNLMSESLYSSGFNDSENDTNASIVYPC